MTLQEQYNNIKQGKGSKQVFLKEAKSRFPNILTNRMPFEEASQILTQRGVITENYVDLQPINSIEASPKTTWENKFADFIAEVKKEDKEENIKAELKKTDKSVDEVNDHGFDTEDKKNLDNQIGQEVLNGIYFEAKQNPDKDLDEVRKIVSKNLEKDGQYYMKNAAFGVEGLGYQETEVEEVSGKYKASGYSDKLKKLVKESLVKEDHSGNPNDKYVVRPCKNKQEPWAVWEGEVRVKGFANKADAKAFADKKNKQQGLSEDKSQETGLIVKGKTDLDSIDIKRELDKSWLYYEWDSIEKYFFLPEEEDLYGALEAEINQLLSQTEASYHIEGVFNESQLKESYDEFQRDDKGSKDVTAKDKGEEEAYGAGVEKGEKIEKKKMKKESLESKLAEIDKQGAIVALEAKIDMVGEAIEKKNNRISMVSEDENLSELVDKTKIKAMQKEVKLLEKQKAKMEKMYEKMCGKSYTKEVIDETYSEDE